jgi:hypothetical protein
VSFNTITLTPNPLRLQQDNFKSVSVIKEHVYQNYINPILYILVFELLWDIWKHSCELLVSIFRVVLKTIGPVLAHTIIYPIMSKVNIHICKYGNHLQFRDASLSSQSMDVWFQSSGMTKTIGTVSVIPHCSILSNSSTHLLVIQIAIFNISIGPSFYSPSKEWIYQPTRVFCSSEG